MRWELMRLNKDFRDDIDDRENSFVDYMEAIDRLGDLQELFKYSSEDHWPDRDEGFDEWHKRFKYSWDHIEYLRERVRKDYEEAGGDLCLLQLQRNNNRLGIECEGGVRAVLSPIYAPPLPHHSCRFPLPHLLDTLEPWKNPSKGGPAFKDIKLNLLVCELSICGIRDFDIARALFKIRRSVGLKNSKHPVMKQIERIKKTMKKYIEMVNKPFLPR